MTPTDRELGMSRPITRRDFIHDVGITALSITLPLPGLAMPQGGSELYYPPTLTGLRGSHPGSCWAPAASTPRATSSPSP